MRQQYKQRPQNEEKEEQKSQQRQSNQRYEGTQKKKKQFFFQDFEKEEQKFSDQQQICSRCSIMNQAEEQSCQQCGNPFFQNDKKNQTKKKKNFQKGDQRKNQNFVLNFLDNINEKQNLIQDSSDLSKIKKQGRWEEDLPIFACKKQLIENLKDQKLLICVAETGSGKSTQIPQFLADAYHYFPKKIICTQPRVLAAIAIAKRIALEYSNIQLNSETQNSTVGYQTGLETVPGNRILIMTEQCLINNFQDQNYLLDVSVIIVDEAHERNLQTDVLLGLIKQQQKQLKHLHVIITSATIDPYKFLQFFEKKQNNKNIFHVEGRLFNVNVKYEPYEYSQEIQLSQEQYLNHLCNQIMKYFESSQKHALVFLPGQNEIERTIQKLNTMLRNKQLSNVLVFPLYSKLSIEEQQKLFDFDKTYNYQNNNQLYRMIICSTNIAETSITLPGIKLVIDTGLVKEFSFDQSFQLPQLKQKMISISSANQRKGRAGRLENGTCIRIYKENDLTEKYNTPEIYKADLRETCLKLLGLKIDPYNFDFIDKPDDQNISSALKYLKTIDCIDSIDQLHINEKAQVLFELPFPPNLGNFILNCFQQFNLFQEAITIAAIVNSPQKIFQEKPAPEENKIIQKQIQELAKDYDSDLIFLYETYKNWEKNQQNLADPYKEILNEQILKIIQLSIEKTIRVLQQKKFQQFFQNNKNLRNQQQNELKLTEIISICLLQSNYIKIVQTIVPNDLSKGLRLLSNNLICEIGSNSCEQGQALFEQTPNHFIAMDHIKLINGKIVLSYLHPLYDDIFEKQKQDKKEQPKKVDSQLEIKKDLGPMFTQTFQGNLYDNISVRTQFQKEIKKLYPQLELISYYDIKNCQGIVYGPENQQFKQNISKTLNEVVQKEIDMFKQKTQTLNVLNNKFQVIISQDYQIQKLNQILLIENNSEEIQQQIDDQQNQQEFQIRQIQEINIKFYEQSAQYAVKFSFINSEINIEEFMQQIVQLVGYEPYNKVKIYDMKHFQPQPAQIDLYFSQEQDQNQIFSNKTLLQSLQWYSKKKEIIPRVEKFENQKFRKIEIENISSSLKIKQLENKLIQFNNSFKKIKIKSTKKQNLFQIISFKVDEQQYQQINDNQEFLKQLLTTSPFYIIFSNMNSKPFQEISNIIDTKYLEFDQTLFNQQFINAIITKAMSNFKKINILIKENIIKIDYKQNQNQQASNEVKAAYNFLKQYLFPVKINTSEIILNQLIKYLEVNKKFEKWQQENKVKIQIFNNELQIFGMTDQQSEVMRNIQEEFDIFRKNINILQIDSKFEAKIKFKGKNIKDFINKFNRDNNQSGFISFNQQSRILHIFSFNSQNDPQNAINISEIRNKLCQIANIEILDQEQSNCMLCQKESLVQLQMCGHKFCMQCINKESELQNLQIKCPLQMCNQIILLNNLIQFFETTKLDKFYFNLIRNYLNNDKNVNFTLCNTVYCNSPINKNKKFTTCQNCFVNRCLQCYSQDQDHQNLSCEEFYKLKQEQQINKSALQQQFQKIIENAQKYCNDNWLLPNFQQQKPIILNNKCIINEKDECNSIKKFLSGVKELKSNIEDGFFAWHGTSSDEAILGICCNGFDTNRRSGQVHGPGEYFGINPIISSSYSQKCGKMILTYILNSNSKIKKVENYCYVVNNPMGNKTQYCVPVLVIQYDQNSKNINLDQHLDKIIPDVPNNQIPTKLKPWRWQWGNEEGYHNYDDELNDIIETQYENWKFHQGPPQFTTNPIRKNDDDALQVYIIDYNKLQQINKKTRNPRVIHRIKIEFQLNLLQTIWHYQDNNNQWIKYQIFDQQQINQLFISYSDGKCGGKNEIKLQTTSDTYLIDFIQEMQINKNTNQQRKIRSSIQQ